jgi:hypothetical protein
VESPDEASADALSGALPVSLAGELAGALAGALEGVLAGALLGGLLATGGGALSSGVPWQAMPVVVTTAYSPAVSKPGSDDETAWSPM